MHAWALADLHLTGRCCLQEMQENLEVVRDVWGMQLDAARNRIIRVELMVAVASLALMALTVPGALFGMNIPHGFEVPILVRCKPKPKHAQAGVCMPLEMWHASGVPIASS